MSPFSWPAFSKECLLSERWYLGGVPKDCRNTTGVWFDMMKVTEASQFLFLERIFFIHNLTKSKGGKSQSTRIPLSLWNTEMDITCLACYVFEAMRTHRTPDNNLVFQEETIKVLVDRYNEGRLYNHKECACLIPVKVAVMSIAFTCFLLSMSASVPAPITTKGLP